MKIRSFFDDCAANGYIYVLSNPAMPGLLKIGFTLRDVHERVAELNSSTSIPRDFVLEALFASPAAQDDERLIHTALSGSREGNKEFFRIRSSEAIRKIVDLIGFAPLETRLAVSKCSRGVDGAWDEAYANLKRGI